MRLPTLPETALFTAAVAAVSFVGGSIAETSGAISKYVLPKLGFHNVCGISVITISKHAFTASTACFSTFAFLTLALLAVSIYIRCSSSECRD